MPGATRIAEGMLWPRPSVLQTAHKTESGDSGEATSGIFTFNLHSWSPALQTSAWARKSKPRSCHQNEDMLQSLRWIESPGYVLRLFQVHIDCLLLLPLLLTFKGIIDSLWSNCHTYWRIDTKSVVHYLQRDQIPGLRKYLKVQGILWIPQLYDMMPKQWKGGTLAKVEQKWRVGVASTHTWRSKPFPIKPNIRSEEKDGSGKAISWLCLALHLGLVCPMHQSLFGEGPVGGKHRKQMKTCHECHDVFDEVHRCGLRLSTVLFSKAKEQQSSLQAQQFLLPARWDGRRRMAWEPREAEKGCETERKGWHQSRKTIRSYLIIDLMMKIQLDPICGALMCFKTSGAQKTTLQACRRTYSISLSASKMFTKKPPIWHKANFYQIWIGSRMKPRESSRISRIKFWKV